MANMLVIAAAFLMVMKVVSATTFTVGDASGWTRPSSSDFYSSWAASHSFSVGDILVFQYGAPHTVAVVASQGDYDQCNARNAQVNNVGPTEITLDRAGSFFFICTVSSHCSDGQKLAINVTGTSNAPPTPSSPATQAPPNHGSSLPVPLTTTFSLFFMAFVITLLY